MSDWSAFDQAEAIIRTLNIRITEAQHRSLRRIIVSGLRKEPDVKYITVYPKYSNGAFSIVLEVGREHDQGTWAEVYCRYHGFFTIGPRGGISARPVKNKARAEKYPLIYGWDSFGG